MSKPYIYIAWRLDRNAILTLKKNQRCGNSEVWNKSDVWFSQFKLLIVHPSIPDLQNLLLVIILYQDKCVKSDPTWVMKQHALLCFFYCWVFIKLLFHNICEVCNAIFQVYFKASETFIIRTLWLWFDQILFNLWCQSVHNSSSSDLIQIQLNSDWCSEECDLFLILGPAHFTPEHRQNKKLENVLWNNQNSLNFGKKKMCSCRTASLILKSS